MSLNKNNAINYVIFFVYSILSFIFLMIFIRTDLDIAGLILNFNYTKTQGITNPGSRPALLAWSLLFVVFLVWLNRLEVKDRIDPLLRKMIFGLLIMQAIMAVFIVPFHSMDMYAYVSFGREYAVLKQNPYTTYLSALNYDPIVRESTWTWFNGPMPSGPISLLFYMIPSLFPVTTIFQLVFINKIIWCIVFIAMAPVLLRLMGEKEHKLPLTVITAFFINPVIIILLLIDGHNEVIILLLFTFFLMAALKRKWIMAALFLVLACMIKITFILFVPLAFIFLWRTIEDPKKRIIRAASAAAIGLVVYILLYLPFDGVGVFTAKTIRSIFESEATGRLVVDMGILARFIFELIKGFELVKEGDIYALTIKITTYLTVLSTIAYSFIFASKKVITKQSIIYGMAGIALIFVLLTPYHQLWYYTPALFIILIACTNSQSLLGTVSFFTLFGAMELAVNRRQISIFFGLLVFIIGFIGYMLYTRVLKEKTVVEN